VSDAGAVPTAVGKVGTAPLTITANF
jgi:hypothetical protein